jgi:hypothetical protein
MSWYGPDLHNDLVFGNRANLVGSLITFLHYANNTTVTINYSPVEPGETSKSRRLTSKDNAYYA